MTDIQTDPVIVAGIADAEGRIVNTILADPHDVPDIPGLFLPPPGERPIIGGVWDGLTCHPPPPPPPPEVDQISDRQFAMEARDLGFLTQSEAVAFVSSGTIPSFLAAIIAALPTQQERDDAELLVAGATVFERRHPFTLIVGEAMRGNDDAETFIDAFFRSAATR